MGKRVYDPEALYQETSRQDVEQWLNDINLNVRVGERGGGIDLTAAEEDFIASVQRTVRKKPGPRPLTGKQLAWLKQIYDRAEG